MASQVSLSILKPTAFGREILKERFCGEYVCQPSTMGLTPRDVDRDRSKYGLTTRLTLQTSTGSGREGRSFLNFEIGH